MVPGFVQTTGAASGKLGRPKESDLAVQTVAEPSASRQVPPDIIPNILPACSVNLLAGSPGVGKTALTAWMLRQIRDEQPIFGYATSKVPKIAVVGADRSWSSTGKWFALAGYSEIAHYSLQDDLQFNPYKLRNKLARIQILSDALDRLDPLPPGSLVMVDPLALFLGGNLSDYDSCAIACTQIRRLCQERGITIIGTAHSSKQKADKKERYLRLQDRINGSGALFGYTDTQMYLASPEETGERHYTFLWAPHHARPETFPLGRDQNGLFVPWEESVAATEEGKLLALIPAEDPGIGFGELVLKCGDEDPPIARTTVYRYLQELMQEGRILKCGHGHYKQAKTN